MWTARLKKKSTKLNTVNFNPFALRKDVIRGKQKHTIYYRIFFLALRIY